MAQKILLECILPKEYNDNTFEVVGLPTLQINDFYSITKDFKLVKRILQENGFGFDSIDMHVDALLTINQMYMTSHGKRERMYTLSVVDGSVFDIKEVI